MNHIGQYKLVATLGKGGMGMVHLGEHVLLGRRAAVKTLLPALSARPEIVERFFTEARATARISDPGIVQVFDFGYHVDGTAYIVMELLEGEGLFERMNRIGPLPVGHALRIVRQVACALAAAHSAGIVHRDLKPENLFIVQDPALPDGERVKLLDFGICKMTADDVHTTEAGIMLGTPVYMSPEQCRGSDALDGRADIYSLGGVLFHMLTEHTPFEAGSSGEYIVAQLTADAPAPSTRVPGISPAVDALVLRCLAKDPDARFASMIELTHEIDRVLVQLGHEEEVARAPKVMRLATGFKSSYQRPTLHVTSTPVTVAANRGTWRAMGKVALAAAIVASGLAVGMIATDDREVAAATPIATPIAIPVAIPAPPIEPPPAVVEPITEPAPSVTEVRPSAPVLRHPAARPTSAQQDLYDTR